jgi:hypothetical protein
VAKEENQLKDQTLPSLGLSGLMFRMIIENTLLGNVFPVVIFFGIEKTILRNVVPMTALKNILGRGKNFLRNMGILDERLDGSVISMTIHQLAKVTHTKSQLV